jgi:hypothetical protein
MYLKSCLHEMNGRFVNLFGAMSHFVIDSLTKKSYTPIASQAAAVIDL